MKNDSNQENRVLEIKLPENAADIFRQVIEFLQLFMPVTLAKRLVAVILLAIRMLVMDAVEPAGLCERSMWTLKKQLREHPVPELMVLKSGSGRKGKTAGLEKQILEEVGIRQLPHTPGDSRHDRGEIPYQGFPFLRWLI